MVASMCAMTVGGGFDEGGCIVAAWAVLRCANQLGHRQGIARRSGKVFKQQGQRARAVTRSRKVNPEQIAPWSLASITPCSKRTSA